MKFAHEFQSALLREGFPEHWVASAFPYKQLKKSIKKVQKELEENNVDFSKLEEGAFEYDFQGDRKRPRPRLTLLFESLHDTESTPSRTVLSLYSSDSECSPKESSDLEAKVTSQHNGTATKGSNVKGDMKFRRVEIPLTLDAEFFTLVKVDVKHLDLVQENTEKALVDKIAELSQQVISLTRPSRYKTTDMNRWRELFDIYLQAGVFFSTKELDHGRRNSTVAKRQLEWFQEEVHRRGLTGRHVWIVIIAPGSFKLSVSREALNRFLDINVTLWQNLKYQEMNQQAIGKILKKFDKRTLLGARKTFPKFIQRHPIISSSIAKAVCSRITQDLIKITPQLDDFLCPICLSVVWRPIKMKCQHLFCIGCTVAMQRQRKKFCPLCRENVILDADTDSIDEELSKYLRKYFPKEVRQKQIELETAAGREQFGVLYKHPSEQRCNIM